MCMAKQRQPLTLSGTSGEEGHRGGKLVTVTEALHQSPTVLCLQTTPGRGTKEKERGRREREEREGRKTGGRGGERRSTGGGGRKREGGREEEEGGMRGEAQRDGEEERGRKREGRQRAFISLTKLRAMTRVS